MSREASALEVKSPEPLPTEFAGSGIRGSLKPEGGFNIRK